MTEEILSTLHGALTVTCVFVGVKFLKFGRVSRDRFFFWFAAAFWAMAVSWTLRVVGPGSADHDYYVYLPRLLGFVLIVVAIVDKNRRAASG